MHDTHHPADGALRLQHSQRPLLCGTTCPCYLLHCVVRLLLAGAKRLLVVSRLPRTPDEIAAFLSEGAAGMGRAVKGWAAQCWGQAVIGDGYLGCRCVFGASCHRVRVQTSMISPCKVYMGRMQAPL
jgi:hypothetical protein